MTCRCGCGQAVKPGRAFVDKEHQLDWMARGGARELANLQPREAKVEGGRTAGHQAAESGRLAEAAQRGGARSREIAEGVRARRGAIRGTGDCP